MFERDIRALSAILDRLDEVEELVAAAHVSAAIDQLMSYTPADVVRTIVDNSSVASAGKRSGKT